MSFYPDIKPHVSPSALAAWHDNKSQFIRSYFKNIKSPETSAMKAGKKIHALIEGGFLTPINKFTEFETPITVTLGNGVKVYGIPDSYGIGICHCGNREQVASLSKTTVKDEQRQDIVLGVPQKNADIYLENCETCKKKRYVVFCDYKTGRENFWTQEKLATDLKMLCTAWLVWQVNGKPDSEVEGIIEYIPTEWNDETKEIQPILSQEHEVISYLYSKSVLEQVESLLLTTIEEVNMAYEQFLESTDIYIEDEDCKEYAEIEKQITGLETRQKEIKERIAEQMSFGNVPTYDSDFGKFFFRETKKYAYPQDLSFQTPDGAVMTLKQGEAIDLAMSVVKKNWERENKPASVSKSLQFRAKK